MHYKQLCRATKIVITGISIIVFLELRHTLSKREVQVRGVNTKYKIKDIKNWKFWDKKFILHTSIHFSSYSTHTHTKYAVYP